MILLLLICVTLAFFVANAVIAKYDYLNPAVVFCGLFLLYEIICLINVFAFRIEFHIETVAVLVVAFSIFTILNIIFERHREKGLIQESKPEIPFIHVSNVLVIGLIIFQVITCVFFVVYLYQIADAFGTYDRSLGGVINLYDTLTKFWTTTFRELNVPIPMVYRVGNPITTAGAYLIIYIAVNNFIARKRINPLHIISIFLLCVLIILNGSRSPLLRVFTMIIILLYILRCRKKREKRATPQFFLKVMAAAFLFVILMVIVLSIMGRSEKTGELGKYLFIYTGAPIVNLDNYIYRNAIKLFGGQSEMFGAYTFQALYAYLGKLFGINQFIYPSISTFMFSNNGIEIGNVYTVFYKFIYDFGFFGVIPLTLIMALYYLYTYRKCMINPGKNPIDFRLFIYTYLFNDLVMSPFSCRFYETILDAPFIKLLIISWLLNVVFIKKCLNFGDNTIRLTEFSSKRTVV